MAEQVGLFLNPVGQRRADFQTNCADLFGKLFAADGVEQAAEHLAEHRVDLLIVDLERFDRHFDLDGLRELIARRAGAGVLLLCPFTQCGMLAELLALGAVSYAVTPLADAALRQAVAARLAAPAVAPGQAHDLRRMLALRGDLQQVLAGATDLTQVADQLCAAMCAAPGVVHAALFTLCEPGDLKLEAQHSPKGLNLVRILYRSDRLLQSPLRHAFPGLLAASTGELALLDAPAKAGEADMTEGLAEKGVEMVLGLPLQGIDGAPGGALCLMFEHARQFSADELSSFVGLAQLIGLGMRMACISRENAGLLGRVTHLATVDTLTGVANRRHGEHLLELEIRRARRYRVPVSLIGFDIDGFKAVNDQFGHPVGDAALRNVANAALEALRTSDVLVRSGGEEFMIIAPHTGAMDALRMAEKIRATIAQTDIPGCDKLTISVGAAELGDQEGADMLMSRVDAALARAKRAGRNRVELAHQ